MRRLTVVLVLVLLFTPMAFAAAPTYQNVVDTMSQDQALIPRIEGALVEYAMFVKDNTGECDGGTGYASCRALAQQVILSPRQQAAQMIIPIFLNPTASAATSCTGSPAVCTTSLTDFDLKGIVIAVFRSVAK